MTEPSTQSAVRYDRGEDGIVVLTLDDPTASANTMNEVYRDAMSAAVDRLEAEQDDVVGVVVTSAKKTFFAGGNLKKMIEAGPDDAPAVFAEIEGMKKDLRRLETLGRPEVTLGLLPGGGGVTRVTRMLGLFDALMGVLVTGTRFKPAAARDKGLV